MTPGASVAALAERVDTLLARRNEAGAAFYEQQADRIARLCHRMAERFARGGRLVAFGASPAARSDARHVAVEFVHPVIVGKRALPAIGITGDGGALATQARLILHADDIALAFGDAPDAIAEARARGCLAVDLPRDFPLPGEDPFVHQELLETLYHVLWELVHVYLEHQGLLEGRRPRTTHDAGASSFLYPFLAEQETDLEAIVADVRRSVLMKADEVAALREQTLGEGRGRLVAASRDLRARLDAGGTVFALGNGGSATDAMDLVADLRYPPHAWPHRRALDLTEDTAIITAVANDVGFEAIFARQVIAYGRPGDIVVALTTSGGSGNVLAALAEARRRGLGTLALVGYDGGRILADGLADHVIVSRSEHIPRIQEAQASACHVLRELIELAT